MQYLFEDTGLTHYGGMGLINSFCKKLNLKWLLQTYERNFLTRQLNAVFFTHFHQK